MEDYKQGSHTVWDCKYHLEWTTKYRRVGQHVRARGYWVVSSGNVTDEVQQYHIEEQKPPEPDDDFEVIQSAGWPTDPASSRNPKPPALAGGVFTEEAR